MTSIALSCEFIENRIDSGYLYLSRYNYLIIFPTFAFNKLPIYLQIKTVNVKVNKVIEDTNHLTLMNT